MAWTGMVADTKDECQRLRRWGKLVTPGCSHPIVDHGIESEPAHQGRLTDSVLREVIRMVIVSVSFPISRLGATLEHQHFFRFTTAQLPIVIAEMTDTETSTKAKKEMLREVPRSETHFWKDSLRGQISQQVEDRDSNGHKRSIPANETLAMALNEIAAQRRHGFFFHLPSREALKKSDNEKLLPASRTMPMPGFVEALGLTL